MAGSIDGKLNTQQAKRLLSREASIDDLWEQKRDIEAEYERKYTQLREQ